MENYSWALEKCTIYIYILSRIGHRMYKNIYKQNSRLEDNRESVIINKLEHIQKVQVHLIYILC